MIRLSAISLVMAIMSTVSVAVASEQRFKRVVKRPEVVYVHDTVYIDSARLAPQPRTVAEILASLPDETPRFSYFAAVLKAPRVFRGYQDILPPRYEPDRNMPWRTVGIAEACGDASEAQAADSIAAGIALPEIMRLPEIVFEENSVEESEAEYIPNPFEPYRIPESMRKAWRERELADAIIYSGMVRNPQTVEYAFWQLPVPPKMPEQDTSFEAYIRNQWLPKPTQKIYGGLMERDRINWLHDAKASLHFSQAYVSPNWYQGGNNSLSLQINLYWDVQLNQIFHPNLLFDNVISYKLGLTSTPQDKYHKYAISEDLFQWNLKAGVKAFEHWFYSATIQFKTQLLNNYGSDSMVRAASFLSPGDFNAGLGMTYNKVNKKKTVKFNASISPISYNLKTCIDASVDAAQFNIKSGRKTANEIGSNAELTLDWALCKNISYKSRLFLFSNYKYFQGDWENTLSFNINRFLSTQIYCHLRYDSSSDLSSGKWHHWMLKEILSFGFSYAFSTKG